MKDKPLSSLITGNSAEILGSLKKVETLSFERDEVLLVGIARGALHNAEDIARMLDDLLPRFKNRILVYPEDELSFKKVGSK